MSLQAINPATGETIATYDEMSPEQLELTVGQVHEAFLHWRQTDFSKRATMMNNAAKVLREQKETYARIMTVEMGKPIKDAPLQKPLAVFCKILANLLKMPAPRGKNAVGFASILQKTARGFCKGTR